MSLTSRLGSASAILLSRDKRAPTHPLRKARRGRNLFTSVALVRVHGSRVLTFCVDRIRPRSSPKPNHLFLRKKWAITAITCFYTVLVSSCASAYNLGFASMTRDLNATNFQASIGLSVYALGFGIVPLVTASFSEEFGRQPLYIGSGIVFLLMYMMIALAKNIQTVIIARFIQGACGSTGATMVGGTIADIWTPKDRGLPMSIFSLMALGGTGLGPVFAGWIEMNPKLEWRWIQWVEMIICALFLVLLPFVLTETRSSILLMRIAKKIRKETGNHHIRARVEDERSKLSTLIWISCTRPVHLMLTEMVVLSFSIWVGFAWGVLYCLIESISGVFSNLHHFNIGFIGVVFLTIFIGSSIGFLSNMLQEKLYQENFPIRGPEARLYYACFGGVLLPAGMFIYAWSSFERIPWIALAIGIVLIIWAVFIIYVAVFTYLADCYGPFASSALAGQSLARNLAATAFPLFTTQMYQKLDYKWANTLFGCLAALMIPIPFVLFFYGPAIRSKSKFSSAVMKLQQ
ncbi:major facilitator superfamily domain-containing protein [Gymnopilus junonius]|uniref:Major facilitator superfamily domain-containing protein n=1 Tax=Gymnopilus junonius TaxID=109634 RepID=A0A9P5NDL2_GYMJU|nr:major facilitator superfamily domain-containing protein [Gymnopilus junonius]